MQNKIQIFEEKKVRTVWDDETEEWFFSIIDVIVYYRQSNFILCLLMVIIAISFSAILMTKSKAMNHYVIQYSRILFQEYMK